MPFIGWTCLAKRDICGVSVCDIKGCITFSFYGQQLLRGHKLKWLFVSLSWTLVNFLLLLGSSRGRRFSQWKRQTAALNAFFNVHHHQPHRAQLSRQTFKECLFTERNRLCCCLCRHSSEFINSRWSRTDLGSEPTRSITSLLYLCSTRSPKGVP